jgi:hypothetical protein
VRQAEIREAFADGWVVRSIVPERYAMRLSPGYALAWLAIIERQATTDPSRPTSGDLAGT